MKKTFYIIWFLLFVFSIFVVVGGKIRPVGKKFIYKISGSGDLYSFSIIDDYKENYEAKKWTRNEYSLDSASVITLGDSFFNTRIDSFTFPRELADRIHYGVYYFSNFVDDGLLNPIVYFRNANYKPGKRKVLVLETVERYAVNRMQAYDTMYNVRDYSTLERIEIKLLKNEDLEYFFRNNILIKPLSKIIKKYRYKFFGEIDNRIAYYSKDPKMLFYEEAVNSNKREKTEESLVQYADKIMDMSKKLKLEYNIDLVYMIIPNKFTIYYDYMNIIYNYDQFIPRMQKLLAARGVQYIDVYSEFINYRKNSDLKLLYYVGDTHYSAFGKEIVVNATVRKINKLLEEAK